MSTAPATPLHLAQINIARPAYPLDDARIAEFMDNLERVNAIAERSPGFVWRLVGGSDATGATDVAWPGAADVLPNLSVWASAEDLERFVWTTVHKRFYAKKAQWFSPLEGPQLAMWWIPAGARPTLADAAERLAYLAEHGPSAYAFGWESLPDIDAWRAARCA